MSVNDMFEIILFAVRKNGGSGDISPQEFNLIIGQAQSSFSDYLLGQFQQYQPMRPVPTVQYSENENTRQALTPIIYGYTLTINSSTGISPYPGDYQRTDAMWKADGHTNIRFVQQQHLQSYYNSRIDPYLSNPFYLIKDIGFDFFPASLGTAKLSYVRKPPAIVWGYSIDVNGLPVYNASISINPVWADVDCLEIIVRALALIGINLQMPQVSQYAEQIKKGGQ